MTASDLVAATPAWRRTAMPLLAAASGLAGLGVLTIEGLGWAYYRPLPAAAVFAAVAGFVVAVPPTHRPVGRFGAANGVTLLRGVVASWLGGLIGAGPAIGTVGWWVAGATLLVLVLDGIDGRIARRQRTVSAFGAHFDMEVDALFLLVLSILAFHAERAGPWVLAIGLMRYAFLAASLAVPGLRRPLPESFRRKLVCVIQGAALGGCFVPGLGEAATTALLAAALGMLAWSFAADTLHLLRAAPP
ncbi:MAG TPA: CDP-alcohol phosphatidyltransferase family protein [Alphaproteobacteria bacterium]|nr:CDP-alcohol phosphatidyltransferase family protein [Alphaproteobacteria bacterium]